MSSSMVVHVIVSSLYVGLPFTLESRFDLTPLLSFASLSLGVMRASVNCAPISLCSADLNVTVSSVTSSTVRTSESFTNFSLLTASSLVFVTVMVLFPPAAPLPS